jgi:fumarylacetoacetase
MTWLDLPPDTPFGLDALPYGSMLVNRAPHLMVRIDDRALDLTTAAPALGAGWAGLTTAGNLDPLLAAGPLAWAEVRDDIHTWLVQASRQGQVEPHVRELGRMVLPFTVGDYVDFYASETHASNLGRIFRPDSPDPLTPQWKHLPIGYHGRAQTVIVSGSEIPRPHGQRRTAEGEIVFGPSVRLDIECELGFVVGVGSERGTSIPVADFPQHVFGVTLVNDWSARDIQAWEYVPLGPFLGKSFATSIGAWVLPLAALGYARIPPPSRTAPLQDYLADTDDWGLDLDFEVRLNGAVISRPGYAQMYWTPAQMLTHLTINGASTRPGDLYASGTVSGPEVGQRGALIELTWNGRDPITLPDGSTRTFLEDGDEVVITATAPGPGGSRIGLGKVAGRVLPNP